MDRRRKNAILPLITARVIGRDCGILMSMFDKDTAQYGVVRHEHGT